MTWAFQRSRVFVVFVAAMAIFIDSVFYSLVIPLLPIFQVEFGLSDVAVGALVGVFAGAQMIASPFAGYLVDLKGVRVTLLGGLLALLLSTGAFLLGNSFALLLVARALQGACASITWTSALSMIPRALPSDEQGKATGIIMTMAGVGTMVGPLIGGTLAEWGSRHTPFLAVLMLIGVDIACRCLLVDPPEKPKEEGEAEISMYGSFKALLTDKGLVLLLCCTFAGGFIVTGVEPIFPLILKRSFDLNPAQSGLALTMMPLMFFVMSPVVGWLCDKVPNRRRDIVAFGMLSTALLFAPMAYCSTVWMLVMMMGCLGSAMTFLSTPIMPMIMSFVEKRHGGKFHGAAGSLQNMSWSLGCAIAPLMGTAAFQSSPVLAFWMMSGICLSMGTTFVIMSRVPFFARHTFPPEETGEIKIPLLDEGLCESGAEGSEE